MVRVRVDVANLGPDLRTREGAEVYATQVSQRGARHVFDRDGQVAPAAFVFGTQDPRSGHDMPGGFGVIYVSPDMDFNERGKDIFADTVRMIAERSKAIGVVFVTEAWMIFQDDCSSVEQAMAEWRKHGESLANHPARKEYVYLSMEHQTGNRAWVCEITRDQSGAGKLSDTWKELPKVLEHVGRFTGLNYQWD